MVGTSRLSLLFLIIFSVFPVISLAKARVVDLNVGYKAVNFTGKPALAIAVNNQIPGPTLHFKEGDTVTINVHNHLQEGTTIHWHGLLVPWRMDGVAYVTQAPIPPGGMYRYHFKLKQSGTYWYHAHKDLQEQRGLYGAIIIDPIKQRLHYNKDFVVVLSDWINTHPKRVYANLKMDGEFYAQRFPLQASLAQFIKSYRQSNAAERKQLWQSYKMMQFKRMSPYDFSDVAYDAFLLNGHPVTRPWTARVKVGDVVRLRFIGAGASTIFNVKVAGQLSNIVHVQGNDVVPIKLKRFKIAPGETYDILVRITRNKPTMIYVESNDKVGRVYGVLLTQPHQRYDINTVKPFPEPKPISMSSHHAKKSMAHHHGHAAHAPPLVRQYRRLRGVVKTNNPNKPVHKIEMRLQGFMDRYVWFINNKPSYAVKPIMIKHGQRYRLVFINDTMMNHPMHIHGHWFILRNGHGRYDPLLHTVNVPPHGRIVVDFDANTSGQWFFHCHNLYHMKAGMARTFRYQAAPVTFGVKSGTKIHYPKPEPRKWVMANYLEFSVDPFNSTYMGTFESLYGSDNHKLQVLAKDFEIDGREVADADVDLFYFHPISQFWAIKGGMNYFNEPTEKPFWQPGIGIEGLMPFFIETDLRVYFYHGAMKFDLELARDTLIARNFLIRLALRGIAATKTVKRAQLGSGFNELQFTLRPYYRLAPGVNIFVQYEHEAYYGARRRLRASIGESLREDTFSLGLSWMF